MNRSTNLLLLAAASALLQAACAAAPTDCSTEGCPDDEVCDLRTGVCVGSGGDGEEEDGGADGGARPFVPAACAPGCTAEAPHCEPQTRTCRACFEDSHCSGDTPSCDPAGRGGVGVCGCASDSVCAPLGLICDLALSRCAPDPESPDAGRSCRNPRVVAVSTNGETIIPVDLRGQGNDESSACGGGATPDVALAFDLPAVEHLEIDSNRLGVVLSLFGPGGDAGVTCGGPALIECGVTSSFSGALELSAPPPGRYHLVVDLDSTERNRTLNLELDVTPYPVLSCPPRTTFTVPTDGGALTFPVDTRSPDAGMTEAVSCGRSDRRPEEIIELVLEEQADVDVRVQSVGGSDVLFALRSGGCAADAGAVELGCRDNGNAGALEQRTFRLDAGSYFLVYETYDAPGAGIVQVTATPPGSLDAGVAYDDCTNLAALPRLPATGLRGDLTFTTSESGADPYCSPYASGGDLFYLLRLDAGTAVSATLTPDPAAPTLRPMLHIREFGVGNCGMGDVHACSVANGPGQSITVTHDWLPAGDYLLVVDSFHGEPGAFSLDVVTYPPAAGPGGVSCAAPYDLTFSQGRAFVPLATTDAGSDDDTPTCAPGSDDKDRVYRFVAPPLDGGSSLVARVQTVTQNGYWYLPILSLRRDCAGDEIACEVTYAGDSITFPDPSEATIISAVNPTEDYFVWVDADYGGGYVNGPYSLEVDVAEGPVANDSCAAPIAVPVNSSVPGTTLAADDALNDEAPATWYTGAAACSESLSGAELVYAFTATATGPAEIVVRPQRGYDVALALLGSCAQNACLDTEDDESQSVPERISLGVDAGQTYFVTVESSFAADAGSAVRAGGFILSVEQ